MRTRTAAQSALLYLQQRSPEVVAARAMAFVETKKKG